MDDSTKTLAQPGGPRIDIFCRVVDNFGDIGVCWRLARSLHQEWPAQVRLWVDDLTVFRRLAPAVQPENTQQEVDGIQIVHWTDTPTSHIPAEVVIEAFACDPPSEYIDAMPGRTKLWLNLEYLSAEPWTAGFHAQPSPQRNGVSKYFFFPGFSGDTGGLIREADLSERRRSWMHSPTKKKQFLQRIGLPQAQAHLDADTLFISLFCYASAPYRSLLHALRKSLKPVVLLVPQSVLPQLERDAVTQLHGAVAIPDTGMGGAVANRPDSDLASAPLPGVTLLRIPFLPQDEYDQLLWLCDLNFVRGEDSFIRAIWARKPFLWQIYEQSDDIHLKKLQAWLALFPGHEETKAMMRSWNSPSRHAYFTNQLTTLLNNPRQLDSWRRSCRTFAENLSKNKTLSESIRIFYEKAVNSG
ncbi:elongation factor P maturation arginine rhamnosyltransferase EarP [Advenella sp. S44]|uniref:elongation factor P maturation arginine rhamnosyltransferase EarP n=1 Tax=Advenella sp. S44 TaxID=1982755 RepID=UPI001374813A|nr:elongation factor P maturation arginine rhamnosyltransferase EarP [Advenella sp. S44]